MNRFCLSVALLSMCVCRPAAAADDPKAHAVMYAKQMQCPTYHALFDQVRAVGPEDHLFRNFVGLMQYIYRDVAGEQPDIEGLALFIKLTDYVCQHAPELTFYDAAALASHRQ